MSESVIDCLCERRSIRAYTDRPVDENALLAILRAGEYAPTGMNRQSPVMVAVQDKNVREQLRALNAAVMGTPDADPFYGAPTVIVVLADRTVGTYIEDGALVMGNLMNAAHALGVDSCWIHRAREEFESETGKALLVGWGLDPEKYVGIGHCILGYRACEYPAARPRKENRVIRV